MNKGYMPMKRALDVVASAAGLVLLSPVVGVVACLVRRNLGSPVIFKQERPGKDGRVFTLYKFRSMRNESYAGEPSKARQTGFGRRLRSTSLDELPSLVNVLKGDMSIVGPRPLLPRYMQLYSETEARRHEVRPGITGLAQSSGRNAIDWSTKLKLDVEYVDSVSFLLDLRIIASTIVSVLTGRGVTAPGHHAMPSFEGNDQ